MPKFDPPAPDTQWMRDLRAVLEDASTDAIGKLDIICEMMPDDPYTYTF